jgi:hypothetical protein
MSDSAFMRVVDDVLLVDDELLAVAGDLVRLGRVLGGRVLGGAARGPTFCRPALVRIA